MSYNLAKEGLTIYPMTKMFYWSKLRAFADSIINVTEKLTFVLGMVENVVGKGENAAYQNFKNQIIPAMNYLFSKFFKLLLTGTFKDCTITYP